MADTTGHTAAGKALSLEAAAAKQIRRSPAADTSKAAASTAEETQRAMPGPPAAAVETADPAPAPKVEGYIDGLDSRWNVVGWARALHSMEERLKVELVEDGRSISGDLAMRFRGDLLDAGRGDGQNGFQITIPLGMFDGRRHNFAVLVALPDEQILLGQLNIMLPSRLPKSVSPQDTSTKLTATRLVETVLAGSMTQPVQNLDTYVQNLTKVLLGVAKDYDLGTALDLLYVHILRRRIDEGGLQTRLTRIVKNPEQLGDVVREVVQSDEAKSRIKKPGGYYLPDLEAIKTWTRLRPII